MALFSKQPDKPPVLKSPAEIAEMRRAGILVAQAHQIVRDMAKPGVRTIDIDQAVEAFYTANNAIPLFKGYPGKVPFPACTCLSINEEVVHGVPGNRQLKDGDLLKVDTACLFPKEGGWCADRAVTLPIGNVRPERLRLIKVAYEVLQIAIDDLPRRRWWSEVASRMQKHVEQSGFACVNQYVGHGIGRVMHESPQVPNFVTRETRKHDFKLVPGLVLAIEPMVNMAKGDVLTNRDLWTVVTKDGLPSVHVEHTVALTASGVVIVTSDEGVPKYEAPATPADPARELAVHARSRWSLRYTYPEIVGVGLFAAVYTAGFMILRGNRTISDGLIEALRIPVVGIVWTYPLAFVTLIFTVGLFFYSLHWNKLGGMFRIAAYLLPAIYWVFAAWIMKNAG